MLTLRSMRNSSIVLAYVGAIVFSFFPFVSPDPVQAVSGQVGASQVTLNPGGGILTNGSDGLRFTINSDPGGSGYDSAIAGQDGVVYRATRQYCCGAGAPYLNIGGTLYGQAGTASGGSIATWSSLTVVATSGATTVGPRTSATGNASATVRYTVVKNSLTYSFDRTVSYTYPNDFVTDSYTFTIPQGNTEEVKFYLGGDTAPGSSDQGYGIMLTTPVRSIISLNTSSRIMFGFREVPGSKIFDGATSQHFTAPYAAVNAGGNIGYAVTASNHDAGLMMQWNLGSTPGTQTASLEQFATQQGTNMNAVFSASSAETGESVSLNISLVNTELTTVSDRAFTLTLPSGLVIGTGSQSNACAGTLTATPGTGVVSITGASVSAAANCVISIPVVSDTAGTYTLSSASVSGLTDLTNNVGTSSLIVRSDNDGDGISNTVESAAPNTGDANNDGTADKAQLFVSSYVSPVTNEYAVLQADAACTVTSVTSRAKATMSTVDTGYTYPMGLMDFTANCGTPGYTTTIRQFYFGASADTFVLRKYARGAYQTITSATLETVTIGGRSALLASYQVTDGGPLDDDGLANGIIVDPAGPAILAAVATPTPTVSATPTPAPSVSATPSAPNTGLPQKSMIYSLLAGFLGVSLLIGQLVSMRKANRAHSIH